MKKIILLFALIVSGIVYSQFTISDSSKDWIRIGNLYHYISLNSKNDKAKFIYIDQNSTNGNITSKYEFTFSTEYDTLNKLYNLIKEHFVEKKIERLTLEFPEGNLYLNFIKPLGSYTLIMEFDNKDGILEQNSATVRKSFPLNMKSVDSIFGNSKKK